MSAMWCNILCVRSRLKPTLALDMKPCKQPSTHYNSSGFSTSSSSVSVTTRTTGNKPSNKHVTTPELLLSRLSFSRSMSRSSMASGSMVALHLTCSGPNWRGLYRRACLGPTLLCCRITRHRDRYAESPGSLPTCLQAVLDSVTDMCGPNGANSWPLSIAAKALSYVLTRYQSQSSSSMASLDTCLPALLGILLYSFQCTIVCGRSGVISWPLLIAAKALSCVFSFAHALLDTSSWHWLFVCGPFCGLLEHFPSLALRPDLSAPAQTASVHNHRA